jgi:hypothetical protein
MPVRRDDIGVRRELAIAAREYSRWMSESCAGIIMFDDRGLPALWLMMLDCTVLATITLSAVEFSRAAYSPELSQGYTPSALEHEELNKCFLSSFRYGS